MKSFEPTKPILTPEDFTAELLAYRDREGVDLRIVTEGMEPLVELNGKRCRCMLDLPRAFTSKNPLATAMSYMGPSLGFKHVYFYEV